MTTIRAFIGISFSDETRDLLAAQQTALMKKLEGCPIRWVKPQNFHLTIHFLGEIDTSKVESINILMNRACNHIDSFTITFTKMGCFPNSKYSKVLWLGGSNADQLTDLVQELHDGLQRMNIAVQGKFSPHLTLGRVNDCATNSQRLRIGTEFAKPPGFQEISEQIGHIVLYKSTLTPSGPVYNIIHRAVLNNPKEVTPGTY